MSKHISLLSAIAAIVALASLYGCAKENAPSTPSVPTSVSSSQTATQSSLLDASEPAAADEVIVTFDYAKQSGHASNQFAVWIEDVDGNFIKTLYTTKFTATGGYKNRPDSIPAWVDRSGLASMTKAEVDAVTGATPKSGTLSYAWDLSDANGNTVPSGEYKFFVEGSLRWKNRVLYSGVIEVGGASVTAQADRQFFYEASDNQTALSDTSPETEMIGEVTARFVSADGS